MNEILFDQLSLAEKAAYVQERGEFIEAQDFYSFFVLLYLLNKDQIKLLYDFSGLLVAVETVTETLKDDFFTDNLNRHWADLAD
jgi:hypothetical protein